jgi:poly(A) polymerase
MSNRGDQGIPDSAPVILDRSHHPLSRRDIDPDALKVLYRLHHHGFIAYLVGGAVRDLLLQRTPQDFDVGTNARPRQIKKLFRNAYLIGRRFRLAQVRFQGGKVIEVATFRREPEPGEVEEGEEFEAGKGDLEEEQGDTELDPDADQPGQEVEAWPPAAPHGGPGGETEQKESEEAGPGRRTGRRPTSNQTFGSPRQDAFRRDISINALFYDIATFSVIDHVGGLEDLAARRIRVVGDPGKRYTEDPVRMWRVLRHAARLGFTLEEKTEQEIADHRHLLATCSGSRLYEELNKDLKSGAAEPFFRLARQHDLLRPVLGRIGEYTQFNQEAFGRQASHLAILDRLLSAGIALSPAEVYGLLLWAWAAKEMDKVRGDWARHLHDAFAVLGARMTLPRALVADVVQTLVIVGRMIGALDTGQMRWSLRRRAHYPAASRLCALLVRGEWLEDKDPFQLLFRQKYGGRTQVERERPKRRRRRRRKNSGQEIPPLSSSIRYK